MQCLSFIALLWFLFFVNRELWGFTVPLTSSLQCWPGLVYQALFVRCCPTKGPDLPKPLNNTTSECRNILPLTNVRG